MQKLQGSILILLITILKTKFMKHSLWILAIGIFLILLKVLIIDIDLPSFSIAAYQPFDEVYYIDYAMNLYKTGSVFNYDKPSVFGSKPIITNIVTYFCLLIFGNNYTGLRFSSIIFAVTSICFLYLILKRISNNKLFLFAGILLFSINYPFTLSNIVVEPTIARMAMALISLYLMILWTEKENVSFHSIFILTVICTLLWLFVYATNAFAILALFIVILINGNVTFKMRAKRIIPFFIGILLSVTIYCILCFSSGESIYEAIRRIRVHEDSISLSIQPIINNLLNIFRKANIFRLNPLILYLFILSLTIVFIKNIKYFFKNINIIPWIFYTCFILQTLFINDFPERKLIYAVLLLYKVNPNE